MNRRLGPGWARGFFGALMVWSGSILEGRRLAFEVAGHDRPLAARRADLQRSAYDTGAITHDPQPHSGFGRAIFRETRPLVGHDQLRARGLASQLDGDFFGPPVF